MMCHVIWQWLALLQKELADISEYSKACELERDSLRAEKRVWVQTEAELRYSVKYLEDTCSEMEQSRVELNTRLQGSKARIPCIIAMIISAIIRRNGTTTPR